MPRPSSKPHAEKKSPVKVVEEPKVIEEETVPGGQTENLLTDVSTQEEAGETAEQVKEEPEAAVESCSKEPDIQQLSASLALWTERCLTEIVEEHILCLDRGEEPEEACRTEDSEAEPTASDPWLQGCMPVVNAAPQQTASSQQMADITPAEEQKPEKSGSKRQQSPATQLATSNQPKKGASLSSPAKSGQVKVQTLKKQKVILTGQSLPAQLLPPISTSPKREEEEVKGENKSLLTPSSTTGSLPLLRNQRPIPKLDPSQLPQRCVFPQHVVVGKKTPTINQKSAGKSSHSAKLEQVSKPQTETATSSSDFSGTFPKRDEADVKLDRSCCSTYKRSRERMPSSGPLTLDRMKLAEGVSLLDPSADEKSSLQSKFIGLATKLNPIQSDTAVPLYSVEQVIAGPPQVTSFLQHQS